MLACAGVASGVFALAACTPLGGWLYDDPTFVVSELTVRGGGNPRDTLEMVLTACNRNDYPLEAIMVAVSLQMDGESLGSGQSLQPFTLQTRDSTKLTVPIPLPGRARGAGDDENRQISFVMTGHTMLNTPIGERRVELFQRVAIRLKPRDEVAHISRAGRPCRPGKSSLPSYMPTPVLIEPPAPPPQPQSQP